jgi:hypothetical protein
MLVPGQKYIWKTLKSDLQSIITAKTPFDFYCADQRRTFSIFKLSGMLYEHERYIPLTKLAELFYEIKVGK